ncbi:DUF6962 family protein [Tellurirhabdus rosea]|uniref:DUF6962 family protein n=1 Tax=Tellurirhabdus rosea TaxID=2674997 RepID=UPI002253229E|nr:hypothetical protein [Tellurirhabdus rosea]
MNYANVLSDAVLAATGVYVFVHFFKRESLYNRLLWALFLLTISATALLGAVRFAGVQELIPLHGSMQILAGSLGVACAVVAVWGLVLREPFGPTAFWSTVAVGLALFAVLLTPRIRVFTQVVQSLGMVVIMVIACFGLLRRNRRAIWIVFAVMILALATKITPQLSANQISFFHYTTALSLICFGQAARPSR